VNDDHQVSVAWVDESSNETRFELQRVTYVSGAWSAWGVTVFNLAADVGQYIDYAVTALTRYRYRVRACNAAGCSAWSYTNPATTSP
jgi:hypothetical protein